MINIWKDYLEMAGFEKNGRRAYLRPSFPVAAMVSETPLRVGEKNVRLNVAVEVHDPWVREREYHVMHLTGDVAPEGIFIYYDENPRWLHPDESNFIGAVMKNTLMPWVEYWTRPIHLIEYLKEPVDTVLLRFVKPEKRCEQIFGLPVTKKRLSPSLAYLLSLLYYHIGDFNQAMGEAERYLGFLGPKTAKEGEGLLAKQDSFHAGLNS